MALVCVAQVRAQEFTYNEIVYEVISARSKTAMVGDNSYRWELSNVALPAEVEYNGDIYRVIKIGKSAFYRCDSLANVIISHSILTIDEGAFCRCKALTSIDIPNSVTTIGSNAFSSCSALTSINIPNSVTTIGSNAFSSCSALTSINIPNSVTNIGQYAFASCLALTSIHIPNSVRDIHNEAFRRCTALTKITVDEDNAMYDSREDCNALIVTKSNTLILGCQNTIIPNSIKTIGYYAFYGSHLKSIHIPNSVKTINSYAFSYSHLTSIHIPNSVKRIDPYVFSSCPYLTEITVEAGNPLYDSREHCNALIDTETNTLIKGCENTIIPNSILNINYSAFENCLSLTSIHIPNSVWNIQDGAFRSCNYLTSVTFGNSVATIGDEAFAYCFSLTNIYSCITTPFAINSNVFTSVDRLTCTLYVPQGTIDLYKSTEGWRDFLNIVEFDATAIEDVKASPECTSPVTAIYTLGGQKVTRTTPGHVYLYRHADGSTRKQMAR